MGPVEKLLRDAWSLIEDPNNRCTKYCAVDSEGFPAIKHANACKWCSYGALGKICNDTDSVYLYSDARLYLQSAAIAIFNDVVSNCNDADVINNPPKLYAEAIRLAEKDNV